MRCTLMSFRQTDEGQRDHHILQGVGARTLLVAPGLTTRNKKLLGAMCIATRNKKLLGAPGIATRSKDVTDPTSHQVHQLFLKSLVWIFVQLKKIPKGWRA